MLDISAFAYSHEDTYYKATPSPLLCWDISSPALERRVQIHNDIEEFESLVLAYDWQLDIHYKSLLIDNSALIVTNVSEEIIWASKAFQSMTGYEIDEVIGKTPAFLQGNKTNLQTKLFIKEKLGNFENLKARILNYRKNGECYWCGITISPIKNNSGVITHFIAIEKEVN